MAMTLRLRFDYGHVVPWVRRRRDGLSAIAGPDAVWLRTPVDMRGKDLTTRADFTVSAGQRIPFVLTYQLSHLPPPDPVDAEQALRETEQWWSRWMSQCRYTGRWPSEVRRALLLLKALTYAPTGGILAAATTKRSSMRLSTWHGRSMSISSRRTRSSSRFPTSRYSTMSVPCRARTP